MSSLYYLSSWFNGYCCHISLSQTFSTRSFLDDSGHTPQRRFKSELSRGKRMQECAVTGPHMINSGLVGNWEKDCSKNYNRRFRAYSTLTVYIRVITWKTNARTLGSVSIYDTFHLSEKIGKKLVR